MMAALSRGAAAHHDELSARPRGDGGGAEAGLRHEGELAETVAPV